MSDGNRVAVLGAGAMGTALAVHTARNGADSVLLATDKDGEVVDVWRRGLPHPSLRMPFHHHVRCRPVPEWSYRSDERGSAFGPCQHALGITHFLRERGELSFSLGEPGVGFTQRESPTTKLLLRVLNSATPLGDRLLLISHRSLKIEGTTLALVVGSPDRVEALSYGLLVDGRCMGAIRRQQSTSLRPRSHESTVTTKAPPRTAPRGPAPGPGALRGGAQGAGSVPLAATDATTSAIA